MKANTMKPRQLGWALKAVGAEMCQTVSHHSYRGDMDRIEFNLFGERCRIRHGRQLVIYKTITTAQRKVAEREEYLSSLHSSSGLRQLMVVEIYDNDYELRYQLSSTVRAAPDDQFKRMWAQVQTILDD